MRHAATKPITLALVVAVAACSLAACALAGGTLGGREKCWDSGETRLPSLMKGTLELSAIGASNLATPEGEDFAITFASPLYVASDATGLRLAGDGGGTEATEGELVTVFGGLGADGSIHVCDIEERHG